MNDCCTKTKEEVFRAVLEVVSQYFPETYHPRRDEFRQAIIKLAQESGVKVE